MKVGDIIKTNSLFDNHYSGMNPIKGTVTEIIDKEIDGKQISIITIDDRRCLNRDYLEEA